MHPRQTLFSLTAIVGANGLALLGGCASSSSPPAMPGVRPVTTADLRLLSLTALDACINVPPVLIHDVLAGPDGATPPRPTQHTLREPTSDQPGSIRVQRVFYDANGRPDESTRTVMTLQRTADGAVVLLQTIEHADKVITDFDPPMVIFPATLTGGQPFLQTLRMVVHPIDRPRSIKTSGPATHEIELLGRESISTPAGTFDCFKVRTTLRASLGGAKVVQTTDTHFAPGAGIIAESQSLRVAVLGVPIRTDDSRLVLRALGKPGKPGAPPASKGPSSSLLLPQ